MLPDRSQCPPTHGGEYVRALWLDDELHDSMGFGFGVGIGRWGAEIVGIHGDL